MVAIPHVRLGNSLDSPTALGLVRGLLFEPAKLLPVEALSSRRVRAVFLLALAYLFASAASADAQSPPSLQMPPYAGPQTSDPLQYPATQMPVFVPAQQASFNVAPPVPGNSAAPTDVAASPNGPVPVPRSEVVVEVRVVGNKRTPTEKILRYIHTRPNRVYNAQIVEQDVRRLNSSGLVDSVRAQYQDAPAGRGRIVVFDVFERPTIKSVHYVGNRKVKTKTLSKEAKLKAGDPLEPFTIEEARSRLETFYRDKGFVDARVTLYEGSKATDERVVFVINEGSKQTILWTSFEGNTIASESRLRTQIKSKQGVVWLFGGEVNRRQIQEDEDRLVDYYHRLGFFRARVGSYLVEHPYSDTRDWITLKFVIDEGPRYSVRKLSIIGNKSVDTGELMEMVELKEGQPYRDDWMRRDENAIKDRYGAVGYVFADIKPEIIFDEEPGHLDLVYRIEEGERYRVGKIDVNIAGDYPHTQITTVLNRMSLEPGDIIDIRELRDSQRRLRSSQLFNSNPQNGAMPEIAFSPPTPEEIEEAKTQLARRQAEAGQFRGQDPPDSLLRARTQPPVEDSDRWWNVSFVRPAPAAAPMPGTVPAAQPIPQSQATSEVAGGPIPLPPVRYVERGQSPSSPGLPRFFAPQARAGEVLRYQSYSADGGSTTPTLPPAGMTPTYSTLPGRTAIPPGTSVAMPNTTVAPPATTPYPNPSPAAGQTAVPYVPDPQLPPPNSIGAVSPTPYDPGLNFFGDRDPGGFLGSVPDQDPALFLPLRPEVAETETGRFMFSAGVNSDAGLIGSIVVDEQNFDWRRFPRGWEDFRNGTAFRGRGQRFRIEAMPGSEVQRYMVTFNEPYLFDSQIGLGLNGFYYTRFYEEWDEQRIGGRVSLGYQIAHDLTASTSFRLERVTLSDPIAGAPAELTDALGDSDLLGFGAQLTHDTRDNTFLPTEGHLLTLEFEQVLGSYQYPRAEVDLRKYFMLHERPDGSGRHVLSMKATASYTGDDTPIYEHYFDGGFSTIRGFDFRGASPRVNGVVVGGEFNLLASTEYMFPLTASDMVRGVVFCDTGAAQPTIDHWEDKYRIAPGFGLRLTIPAMGPAPIALDFAFPVVKEDGDEEEVFSFFIGFLR